VSSLDAKEWQGSRRLCGVRVENFLRLVESLPAVLDARSFVI
jgi:hypothetical protein